MDVVGLQSREKVSNYFIQDLDENEMGPANWNGEVLDVTMYLSGLSLYWVDTDTDRLQNFLL